MAKMAKTSKKDALNSSTIRPFENDDYDYLINCTDLITTCQEALQENNFEPDAEPPPLAQPKLVDHSKAPLATCFNCDELSSIRSPSSAASSGLGLSLEEDSSLKYCHSDEEFSSLNSTSAETFSTQALVAEFIEWLDYAENQLDSVCYCAKIATSSSGAAATSRQSDDLADCHSANDRGDNCGDVNNSLVLSRASGEQSDDVNQQRKLVGQSEVIDHDVPTEEDVENDDQVGDEDAYYEDEEAEELMMSLQPQTKCSNPTRTKLCLSETVADWSVILARYKAFHHEFEKIGHRFIKEIRDICKQNFSSTVLKSLRHQKERCEALWIKSFEYLTILQDHPGQRCPRHFLPSKVSLDWTGAHLNQLSAQVIASSSSEKQSLSRSFNSVLCSAQLLPYRALLRSGRHQLPANLLVNKRVELRSTGTGGSSVSIQSRRVQTRSGGTMSEPDPPLDTHSPDGSGSPADSGVFSSSTEKYEIIQKDIGYSSDADMSDAIEAHPHSSDQNSSQRSARKRQVRRRRTRTARPRPWSYHADWTDWDYYQTPFVYNGEHVSNDMLNYDNDNVVRKLTEFGENYETWINAELDSDELKISKPAVVIEKPEIEAYCEESLLDKTDAATSPIPFLEGKIDDETQTCDSKSTQTVASAVSDSGSLTPGPQLDHSKGALVCKSCGNSNSYSSIKFYTSLALAGLFAIFFAVSQFSPEIHKTYSRPPPI